MRHQPSRSNSAIALFAAAMALFVPRAARGQACCAATGAITPGRLSLHEDALVGATTRAAFGLGSFDPGANFIKAPKGTSEIDAGLDLFATVRVFRRAQIGFLLPIALTYRQARDQSATGGGMGDLSLSGRVDLFLAGKSRFVPGIALLAGMTFPTGTVPESAKAPLAVDATGQGVFQGLFGLALEQTFGPVLVNLTGAASLRAPRDVNRLTLSPSTEFSVRTAVGYTFSNDAALALASSFTIEGDRAIDGETIPESGRHLFTIGVWGSYPLRDTLRIQGGLSLNPPISALGRNQSAFATATLTLIHSWL